MGKREENSDGQLVLHICFYVICVSLVEFCAVGISLKQLVNLY